MLWYNHCMSELTRVCMSCGKVNRSQGKKFCGRECYYDHKRTHPEAYPYSEEQRRTVSEKQKGPLNPMWRGGIHAYRRMALEMFGDNCNRCDRDGYLVHHKDHNHYNNPLDGSNWEILCMSCHAKEHGFGKDSRTIISECLNCGKQVKRTLRLQSRGHGKFCSHPCYIKRRYG